MVSSSQELGNPLMEDGEELIVIHTKDIMDAADINTPKNARRIRKDQLQTFITERFVDRSKSIADQLKKNNLPTFST